MHTGMWEHPATRGNVETLDARGVTFVGPVEGPLAHGDSGVGRLRRARGHRRRGARRARRYRGRDRSIGRTIVVTAGPTYEPIDPVRFIGNHSSGKMGDRGGGRSGSARRHGAPGPRARAPWLRPPARKRRTRVTTAEQMRDAVMRHADDADAIVMAAAVADFRPKDAAGRQAEEGRRHPRDRARTDARTSCAELGERARASLPGGVRGRDVRRRGARSRASWRARARICSSPTRSAATARASARRPTMPRSCPPNGDDVAHAATGPSASSPRPSSTGSKRRCGPTARVADEAVPRRLDSAHHEHELPLLVRIRHRGPPRQAGRPDLRLDPGRLARTGPQLPRRLRDARHHGAWPSSAARSA